MSRPREFDASAALDRAVDTFWERGFDGTAVQDLCAAMELNPGSLYGAFGDKRTLFLAALDRYMHTGSRRGFDLIAAAPSGMQGIRAFFDNVVGAMAGGKRKWGCLLTNSLTELALRDPDVAERMAQHLARVEAAFRAALERARAAGELAPGVGPDAAPFLVCVLQGLNVLSKARPGRKALEAIVDTAIARLAAPRPLGRSRASRPAPASPRAHASGAARRSR